MSCVVFGVVQEEHTISKGSVNEIEKKTKRKINESKIGSKITKGLHKISLKKKIIGDKLLQKNPKTNMQIVFK